MKINKNKGFTLVELIVVITILAILATIAFISLQGYGSNSRDSKRLSDLGNMKKVLELYSLKNGHYPNPDNASTITYSGSTAWYLGEFGEQVRRDVERINPSPKDPLTDTYYAYGLTNNRQEYELATILENANNASLNIISQVNANSEGYTAYVSGNYNKKILSVRTGNTIKILGVPTLITTDPNITELNSITETQRRSLFSINNKTNLPGNIIEKINTGILGEGFVVTAEEIYENGTITNTDINNGATSLLLYEGTIEDLSNDTIKAKVGENIKSYYTGTESTIGNIYQDLASEDGIVILDVLISNRQGGLNSKDIALSSNTGGSTPTLTGWRALDPNCNIEDITIGTQTWAGCNSTLGDGVEWGKKYDGTDGTISGCHNYDGVSNASSPDCAIGNPLMASNASAKTFFDLKQPDGINVNGDSEYDTIWGKLYTWDRAINGGACPTGRHVPSDNEWEILETTLNGGINCRNATNGPLCDGLGWNSVNGTKTRGLANTLKIPLSGFLFHDGINFSGRGILTNLWTSDSYLRNFYSGNSTVGRSLYSDPNSFSVRCIKDN